MANVNVNLSLGNNAFTKAKGYNQVFENTQEVTSMEMTLEDLLRDMQENEELPF